MKRCLSCVEIVPGEGDFCRNCGFSFLVPHSEQSIQDPEGGSQEPINASQSQEEKVTDYYSCSQFIVGFVVIISFYVFFGVLLYQSIIQLGSKSGTTGYEILAILILLTSSLVLCWIGVIGWKGEFSFLHFIGLILISYLPFVGQLIPALFIGKGIFVLLERRKLKYQSG